MRRSLARTQESAIDPGASGIRWFKLYEALAEHSSARAYPCKWSPTLARWEADTNATLIRVYSTAEGITGGVDTFVPCYYSPWARRFEVLTVPSEGEGVPFRNDSGETVPAYGVMRVTGSATVAGEEYVTISKPNTSLNRKYLVNNGSTVANGAYGTGTWLEEADWVLYDDANTPAYGESWGPQDGSWELKKWRHGFTIVGNPSGGTTDIVRAWQEEVNQVHGQASGSISATGGTGSLTVFDGNGTTTSKTISVVNRTGIAIDNTAWATATWIGGKWFIEPWVCPA